jgi:xanthine dehydrogenase accessory factor
MNIWHEIKKQLEQGRSLYLLTVIQSEGSAPGRRGFKMLVSENGTLCGSIGGGLMEFNMVEEAKALLDKGLIQQHTYHLVHRGEAQASSGMICSGSQTIAFNHLTKDDLMLVSACIDNPQTLEFNHQGIQSIDAGAGEYCRIKFKDVWYYSELINQTLTAHIFGAGHVSVPTSKLLKELGFSVNLYDNRDEINTFQDNQQVDSKALIDYQQVLSQTDIKEKDYVLLMTHKFTEDKLLLSQLLEMNINYLGVLGSANKIQVMFKALLNKGITQEQLDSVHAPIGINIHSQTTQEIAVSIAAEIVKFKNQ